MLFLLLVHALAGCTLYSDRISIWPPGRESETEPMAAPENCTDTLNPPEVKRMYKSGLTQSRTMLNIDNQVWGGDASAGESTFIIMDLDSLCHVFGVVVAGDNDTEYVSNFSVEVRPDNGTWTKVPSFFEPESAGETTWYFGPLLGQHVAIHLYAWEGAKPNFRAGVLACGCVSTPPTRTLVKDAETSPCAFELNVPERLRTYSSVYGNKFEKILYSQSMLDSATTWAPKENDTGWMILDLEVPYSVYGIVLQSQNPNFTAGMGNSTGVTKKVKVEISSDKQTWKDVKEFSGAETNTRVVHEFTKPAVGRYVNISVVEYEHWPGFRAGVIACPFFENEAVVYCKKDLYDIDGISPNLTCADGNWSRHEKSLCYADCVENGHCRKDNKSQGKAYCVSGSCVECTNGTQCCSNNTKCDKVCYGNQCVTEVLGCMNKTASNYNKNATTDNGSCGEMSFAEKFKIKKIALFGIPLLALVVFLLYRLKIATEKAIKSRAAAQARASVANRRTGHSERRKKKKAYSDSESSEEERRPKKKKKAYSDSESSEEERRPKKKKKERSDSESSDLEKGSKKKKKKKPRASEKPDEEKKPRRKSSRRKSGTAQKKKLRHSEMYP